MALSSGPVLIVLHLSALGVASVVFNGPGPLAWSAVGKKQKNGQRPISVKKLKALMTGVGMADQLPLAR